MDQLSRLTSNLEAFKAKHYRFAIGEGLLLTFGAALALWLVFALAEHLIRFSEVLRLALFLSYLCFISTLFVVKVLKPLLSWMGVVSPMHPERAAQLISQSLQNLDDRLLNVLSLQHKAIDAKDDLLVASLEQKAAAVNTTDFTTAIDGKRIVRSLRYFVLPAFVFFGVLLWNPTAVMDATGRIIAYDQSFVPPAPFEFKLPEGPVQVAAGSDYALKVQTVGDQLPDQLFMDISGTKVRLKKTGPGQFEHAFLSLNNDLLLQVSGAGYFAPPLKIEVIPVPKIVRYTARIAHPPYTGLRDEVITNQSQLRVPVGSKIHWSFDLADADEVRLANGETNGLEQDGNQWHFTSVALSDTTLGIALSHHRGLTDTQQLQLIAEPDQRPMIEVEDFIDSTQQGIRFFNGRISDDYGFSQLKFKCFRSTNERQEVLVDESLEVFANNTEQRISHVFLTDSLVLKPGDRLLYYFEVWDNDGINGPKSTRSKQWTLEVPTLEELKQSESEQAAETKDGLQHRQDELQQINKELEDLKKELLNKKQPDWQDKERLKSLLEQQKEAMKSLKEKLDAQRANEDLREKLRPYSEEILEKQERIQELFDELFDEEYKEKYEEYMELLEEMNKQQMMDQVDEMKMDNESLEKELDRTLELFKQLEFEKSLEDVISEVDDLTRKQKELREKTEEKAEDAESLQEQQEELSEELKDLTESLQKLDELGESLEEKLQIPDVKQEQQSAQEAMDQASEELGKEKQKKAGEQQGKAEDELEKMGDKLSAFQSEQAQSQASENLDDMRQILENLVDLSHMQEDIIGQLKATSANDPRYVSIAQSQKKAMDDVRVVEDSILALSKRVPQLSNQLNEEINWVKSNMEKGLENMTNQPPNQSAKYIQKALVNQQLAMTSLNNLAVLFDGIIENMQQQMQSEMKGDGQCQKPGSGKGGKPSIAQMKQAQKNLNEQMKKLKEAMEKGKAPGGEKPGSKPGMGMPGMSKELARMAAEQSAIRERLRELSNSIEQRGEKPGQGMKELERMMEQTEEDLLYQNITRETLMRQEKIMTRLLESEKAEREREKDNKRESKPPAGTHEMPSSIEQKYLQDKKNELELFKTLPPNLKPYYRKRVNRYFSEMSN